MRAGGRAGANHSGYVAVALLPPAATLGMLLESAQAELAVG